MAFTAPRTWVTDEIVTSALLNTHVRDNLRAVIHPYDFSSADADVANTVTETSLWSKVITGNDMGSTGMLRLMLEGDYLYNNSTSDTIRLRVKFGGSSVVDFGTVVPSNVTNASRWPWELEVRLYNESATNAQLVTARVFGRGKATSAITTGIGWIGFSDAASGGALSGMGQNAVAVDTTADQTFQVTAQWSAANANNSWRKRLAILHLGQN